MINKEILHNGRKYLLTVILATGTIFVTCLETGERIELNPAAYKAPILHNVRPDGRMDDYDPPERNTDTVRLQNTTGTTGTASSSIFTDFLPPYTFS